MLLLLAFLWSATPMVAQNANDVAPPVNEKNRNFEVQVRQLDPNTAPPKKVTREPTSELPKPTLAAAEELVRQLSQSLHSGCCPAKKINDPTCPCHQFQVRMLEFLARQGFSHQQVTDFMVAGGPANLRNAYMTWLKDVHGIPEGAALDQHFKLNFEGAAHPLGWDQGWSKLVLTGPSSTLPWLLMIGAGIGCLVVFVFGLRMVFRRNSSAGTAPALATARLAELEAEAAHLPEEEHRA